MKKGSKKDSILNSAKYLFSKNGYDATSVDEIASQSGVTKSLIYYHFKNKKELLDKIIAEFLEQYKILLKDDSARGIHKITIYLDFLRRNKECLCIILTESLREGENSTAIFKALDTLKECSDEEEQNDGAHWVTEFFTSIVPSVILVCYEENWCQYFGESMEKLNQDFVRAYQLTHGLYHERIGKESL